MPELNEAFDLWLLDLYHQRVHSATGQTPFARFTAKMECLRAAPKDLRDHFRIHARRRVATDRTITLNGKLYEAPIPLIGKQVLLLYHEDQPAYVEVCLNQQSYGFLTPLDLHINARVKRDKNSGTDVQASDKGSQVPGRKAMGREVMAMGYRTFFGFKKEPFQADLKLDEILQTPELMGVKERFDYAIRIGAMALVTGEIGSGKSTALRYAMGQLHPSEYATFYVTAASGSILELYRQILGELGMDSSGTSRTRMTQPDPTGRSGNWCWAKR